MGQEKEVRKPENKPARIFETTRAEFIKVLANPLVPRQVRDHSRSLLSRVKLLDDQSFLAEMTRSCEMPLTEEILATISREAGETHALFLPESKVIARDGIIVKRSYLEAEPAAGEFFFDLLAEELAHSISVEKKFQVATIPDHAMAIWPFSAKEELFWNLRERYFQIWQEDVDPSRMIASVRGFETNFETENGKKVLTL